MNFSEESKNLIEEKFRNLHLLSREERRRVAEDIRLARPEILKPYLPKFWWWRRCVVNVLLVTDGGLNFGTGGSGLSEFITTFNLLNAPNYITYKVTTAYRGVNGIQSINPIVVNHINQFNFDTSVNLSKFDQVWLFGINSVGAISNKEVKAIEAYMDSGGGLFATGDHGSLGKAMCGGIKRVQEMRYWDNTDPNNDLNEVSMRGERRNDTNQPQPGQATSSSFNNQSDGIPQTIAVRTFANGHPHPLLSIPTSMRPSGLIDIMPDHPHEGECKPETAFTYNGHTIPTQIISFSFVKGGNTAILKDPTIPHSFPGISVWDGRKSGAGRIVVDSTWHHFVNINLNGAGSPYQGLDNATFDVIQRYYMNIARWMSRRRRFFCIRHLLVTDVLMHSNLVEASLDNPSQLLKATKLSDLNSIGALAEEEIAARFGPAMAREFLLELLEEVMPAFSEKMNVWVPRANAEKEQKEKQYHHELINYDTLFYTAIGAGFMALSKDKRLKQGVEISEKESHDWFRQFEEGARYGFDAAVEQLRESMEASNRFF